MSDIEEDCRKGRPSASGAKENTLCHGRHQMCLPLPDESSPYSIDGTAQHFRMENPKFKIRKDLIPATITAAEQRDHIVGLVWNDWEKDSPEVFLEQRLWYRQNKFSGQADYVAVRDGKALVIDYKFGRMKVDPARDNLQLLWLAILIDFHYDVDQVTVSVVQPYCGIPTLHTYSRMDIAHLRKRVMRVIRNIDNQHAKLRPGDVQCRYCKAVNICPEIAGKRDTISKLNLGQVTELTNAHLRGILPSLSAVRMLCDKIEAEATDRLIERPELFEGWQVKMRAGKRVLIDPPEACAVLMDAEVVDSPGLNGAMTVRLDKLKRVIQEYNEISAKEADELMVKTLGKHLKQHEPKAKLCPIG